MCSFFKRLFCFVLLSHGFGIEAVCQNLVPNPSFEDTVSCPNSANQIGKAANWHASRESPDYFNECDWITGNTAVPMNFCGFQYAHTGVAYCGFVAFARSVPDGREIFTCPLLSPLIIGKKYIISFYLSLSGIVSKEIACNKIGCLFSTNDFSLPNNIAPIFNQSQFFTDSIVSDSLNWVKIEGSFVADSNYLYLSIGNFFTDSLTDTIMIAPSTSFSYYFIDDISVFEDTILSITDPTTRIENILFPNPANDHLFINNKNFLITNAEIIDARGKLINSIKDLYYTELIKINIKELSTGLYFLKLVNQNSYVLNSKFFKF